MNELIKLEISEFIVMEEDLNIDIFKEYLKTIPSEEYEDSNKKFILFIYNNFDMLNYKYNEFFNEVINNIIQYKTNIE
jgi:hypothetical protein